MARQRIQGLSNFLGVPPIISGTGKATDFKFVGYIYGANPNKSPLKILAKMERGRIQGLPKFLLLAVTISFETSEQNYYV